MSILYTDNLTVLNGVGATTTSLAFDVSKRQLVGVEFITAGGTSVFSVDISNDGTNWVTSVAFMDAQSTTPTTYVTSKSVASGNAYAVLSSLLPFRFIRVVATWTSGTATAILQTAG